jgi:hypothetical protein
MNQAIDRRELWFKAMAGLAGGVIGWVPVEIVNHGRSLGEPVTLWMAVADTLTTALLGAMIGGLILAAEGKTLEVTPQVKQRFRRGFVICFGLAVIASLIADHVFSELLTKAGITASGASSVGYLVLARTTAWTLIGLMLGVGVGLAAFSIQNVMKGALGGVSRGSASRSDCLSGWCKSSPRWPG